MPAGYSDIGVLARPAAAVDHHAAADQDVPDHKISTSPSSRRRPRPIAPQISQDYGYIFRPMHGASTLCIVWLRGGSRPSPGRRLEEGTGAMKLFYASGSPYARIIRVVLREPGSTAA